MLCRLAAFTSIDEGSITRAVDYWLLFTELCSTGRLESLVFMHTCKYIILGIKVIYYNIGSSWTLQYLHIYKLMISQYMHNLRF